MAKLEQKPKSRAVIDRETQSQINSVRRRLEEMREYKRLLALDGIEADAHDKERESLLIVRLLRLEKIGTPLPSYPKPQQPKAPQPGRRERQRKGKPASNCQPDEACYIGPKSGRAPQWAKPPSSVAKPRYEDRRSSPRPDGPASRPRYEDRRSPPRADRSANSVSKPRYEDRRSSQRPDSSFSKPRYDDRRSSPRPDSSARPKYDDRRSTAKPRYDDRRPSQRPDSSAGKPRYDDRRPSQRPGKPAGNSKFEDRRPAPRTDRPFNKPKFDDRRGPPPRRTGPESDQSGRRPQWRKDKAPATDSRQSFNRGSKSASADRGPKRDQPDRKKRSPQWRSDKPLARRADGRPSGATVDTRRPTQQKPRRSTSRPPSGGSRRPER
jgi:hypothetical protein